MCAERRPLRIKTIAAAAIVVMNYACQQSACAETASATLAPGMASDPPAMMKMVARFPQPVRIGDLAGRYVLQPIEAQTVLGHVGTPPILRAADGSVWLAINRRELLGLRSTRVAVSIDQVAPLGEHVALIGMMPDAFAALPPLDPAKFVALPPETIIRVGIVGPFH